MMQRLTLDELQHLNRTAQESATRFSYRGIDFDMEYNSGLFFAVGNDRGNRIEEWHLDLGGLQRLLDSAIDDA